MKTMTLGQRVATKLNKKIAKHNAAIRVAKAQVLNDAPVSQQPKAVIFTAAINQ